MAVERINIERFLELSSQFPVFDVRSPGEFRHAHLPGAYSLPLFTDEERKIIGTTYKQQSRQRAIKTGLDYFGPRMRTMVEDLETLIRSHTTTHFVNEGSRVPNTVLIYCWRGGMRSAAVSWLMDLCGFKVYTLIGGYKKYRNYVLDSFRLPVQFNILGGYTGSGKTEVLKALEHRGDLVIDLEDIAKHKGSAFGNIGMPQQPGQEMFENMLADRLRQVLQQLPARNLEARNEDQPASIWLEDESQRIGLVNIPHEFWKSMRQSPVYFLDIPFGERLVHITEEYGKLDKQRVIDAIERIQDKLGGLNAKTAIQLLEEGNTIESFRILLKYYDKYYLKALHNREEVNSLLHTIECNTVTVENVSRLTVQPRFQHEKP